MTALPPQLQWKLMIFQVSVVEPSRSPSYHGTEKNMQKKKFFKEG